MTFHLNLSTFLLDSVISPVNLFLQFSQIDYLCFITTLLLQIWCALCMHEFPLRGWDDSGNLFIILPLPLSPPFLPTLVSICLPGFAEKESGFSYFFLHFVLAFLQHLSFYKLAYKSKAKRKDRQISFSWSTRHIRKHKNPNTQVLQTDWSFMLCVVQLLFQCIIHATWQTLNGRVLYWLAWGGFVAL